MSRSDLPGCWYALENGNVLVDGSDSETGQPIFLQLQSSRQVTPEDLLRYDRAMTAHLTSVGSRWSRVVAGGLTLLLLLLAFVPLELLLAQFDATEAAGGWMFWVGLPLAALAYLTVKVAGWRLERGTRLIQQDAGLVTGMIDEILHARGLELIETHGLVFQVDRGNGP